MPGSPRHGALKLKAQIYCGDEPAMGPGKAELMEAIDREGSISAAGRAMGMSYRRAWLLVDAMNRCFTEPLIAATAGGGAARGAQLTPLGRKVLAAWRDLEDRMFQAAQEGGLADLSGFILDQPRPSQRAPNDAD